MMLPNVTNNKRSEALCHLRQGGLRLLGWPLLCLGGLMFYILAAPGELRLHIDPLCIGFGLLSYRFMTGQPKYLLFAIGACWVSLIGGSVLIISSLIFPQISIQFSAFVVLFVVSKQNLYIALAMNGLLAGFPIRPLTRARRAFMILNSEGGSP